jgi:hypothetical protein
MSKRRHNRGLQVGECEVADAAVVLLGEIRNLHIVSLQDVRVDLYEYLAMSLINISLTTMRCACACKV